MRAINIFIGWDSREPIAFEVLAHSILTRCSMPVTITPLVRSSLRRIYTRERGPTESTEFSLTRFLVPYLMDYQGFGLFMDCDMLVQVDLLDLWLSILSDPGRAVWCCQHDYAPKASTKFLGNVQTRYPMKNWSSLMMFDAAQCQALTLDYVNTATGLDLHRFNWLADPATQIGALPLTWNHLVGEYDPDPDAAILHYTNGTPCFDGYRDGPEAARWLAAYARMTTVGTAALR